MGDRDTLWRASRAGGIHDVGQVFRALNSRRSRALVVGLLAIHADSHDAGRPREALLEPGLGQDDRNLAVLEEIAESFGRQGVFDRKKRRAGSQDGEHRDDLLPAFFHHDADERVGGNPSFREPAREKAREPVELPVSQLPLSGGDRDRLRPPGGLLLEELVEK